MTTDIDRIADVAQRQGLTVAAAESLTAGSLSAALGKGDNAARWFAGGVVAYLSRVKFDLLDVDPGLVITERCAHQMAEGVRRLLHADAAVAVTGAGGPDQEEGKPPGTVFVATSINGSVVVQRHTFEGDPSAVVGKTVENALHQLAREFSRVPVEGPDFSCSQAEASH